MKRTAAILSTLALLVACLVAFTTPFASARGASTPKAVNGGTVTKYLRTAVAQLPVAAEVRAGYARTKFKHWNDVDRDCQNARAEVLKSESKARTTGKCTIATGRWISQYDGATIYQASRLDVDHMVPLAEAWDSGARAWSDAKRQAYANDLTDPRTLIAVSASSNRSKGDRDPAQWMPKQTRCKYVMQWTIVKLRWGLKVDATEKATLKRVAGNCPNWRFTTHRAIVKTIGGSTPTGGGGGSTGTGGGGSTGGGGLDPRFGTCGEAIDHGYGPYYSGTDPEYAWYQDRDHDGIVCE